VKTVLQSKLVPLLDFLIFDWLGVDELLQRERYGDHSRETLTELIAGASEIAAQHFEPAARASDTEEPYMQDGSVVLPASTHAAWKAYRDFGFMGASHDYDIGGMQIPRVVDMGTRLVFTAAGPNLVSAMLTEHNAALLLTHGTQQQQDKFALPQLAGEWTGTMALSEPQAGSSLADIVTRAEPDGPDHDADPLGPRYRIFGSKMWISAAEHDLTPNIVHLVLAKTPAPTSEGRGSTRDISLFIVPKFLVGDQGQLTERNDIGLIGLNHKLGSRGVPNTALAFGDGTTSPNGRAGAIGYLVGRPGEGLRQMFHMMNAARVEIGLASAALGFAGFATSLDYAKGRRQGRHATAGAERKDPAAPPIPIVEHADVKRMLLAQKTYSTAGLALGLYAGRLFDEQETGQPESAHRASKLLDLLTPVVKSWPSEWCLEANSLAIQVMGGAGYTRDFPVEMYWRDQRLNMIHEGTHGIQAIDLLGRKVILADAEFPEILRSEIAGCVRRANAEGLARQAADLEAAFERLVEATDAAWATDDRTEALANATPYLQGFGHVVVAWLLLDLALAATDSEHQEAAGASAVMRYFYAYELPKIGPWLDVVVARDRLCLDLPISSL